MFDDFINNGEYKKERNENDTEEYKQTNTVR